MRQQQKLSDLVKEPNNLPLNQQENSQSKNYMLDQDIFDFPSRTLSPGYENDEMSNLHPQHSLFACLTLQLPPKHLELRSKHSTHADHELSFTQLDFFPSNQHHSDDELSNVQSPLSCLYEEQTASNLRNAEKRCKSSNNAVDYILKHCLKVVLSKDCEALVASLCSCWELAYCDFRTHWESQRKSLGRKHIGINRFEKIIKSKSPFVEVFKYFLVIYLQDGYITYLASTSICNKSAYIDSAIKLAYTLEVSKQVTSHLLEQAQTGLTL